MIWEAKRFSSGIYDFFQHFGLKWVSSSGLPRTKYPEMEMAGTKYPEMELAGTKYPKMELAGTTYLVPANSTGWFF